MVRWCRAIAWIAVAASLATGCGDDDPATSAPGAPGAPGATAAASEATSVDATPAPVDTADAPAPGGAPGDGGGLAGTWELAHLTFDDDADYVLDDAERTADVGMRYGFTSIELRADGTCVLAEDEQRYEGTCRVGPCSELATRPEDCDLLAATGSRMLSLEPGPAAMATFGGTYGLLGWTDDELVFKDMSGAQGTIYVYERQP